MRASALLSGVAALLCGCGSADFSGPEHDDASVTLQDLIIVPFPSKPELAQSVEGNGMVWSGTGWQVRYGMVDLGEKRGGVFSDLAIDCASMTWDGSLQTVLFYHGRPERVQGSGEVRPHLEAKASDARLCEFFIRNSTSSSG